MKPTAGRNGPVNELHNLKMSLAQFRQFIFSEWLRYGNLIPVKTDNDQIHCELFFLGWIYNEGFGFEPSVTNDGHKPLSI